MELTSFPLGASWQEYWRTHSTQESVVDSRNVSVTVDKWNDAQAASSDTHRSCPWNQPSRQSRLFYPHTPAENRCSLQCISNKLIVLSWPLRYSCRLIIIWAEYFGLWCIDLPGHVATRKAQRRWQEGGTVRTPPKLAIYRGVLQRMNTCRGWVFAEDGVTKVDWKPRLVFPLEPVVNHGEFLILTISTRDQITGVVLLGHFSEFFQLLRRFSIEFSHLLRNQLRPVHVFFAMFESGNRRYPATICQVHQNGR
jgi:hypothetical protein